MLSEEDAKYIKQAEVGCAAGPHVPTVTTLAPERERPRGVGRAINSQKSPRLQGFSPPAYLGICW